MWSHSISTACLDQIGKPVLQTEHNRIIIYMRIQKCTFTFSQKIFNSYLRQINIQQVFLIISRNNRFLLKVTEKNFYRHRKLPRTYRSQPSHLTIPFTTLNAIGNVIFRTTNLLFKYMITSIIFTLKYYYWTFLFESYIFFFLNYRLINS